MIKIFDSSWDIIYIKENNIETNDYSHPFNNKKHKHLVGHILAKKKDNRDYDLNYKITSMNYLEYKKWLV